MAKLSTKEIIDSIKEMTILEVKDLVDAMKGAYIVIYPMKRKITGSICHCLK